AVCFLWHFPWGRPRRPLTGIVFPWSPDFPLPVQRTGSDHPAICQTLTRKPCSSSQAVNFATHRINETNCLGISAAVDEPGPPMALKRPNDIRKGRII